MFIELNLSMNRIAALPSTLGKLVNLVSLQLEKNKLTYLPLSMIKLKRLFKLNIKRKINLFYYLLFFYLKLKNLFHILYLFNFL